MKLLLHLFLTAVEEHDGLWPLRIRDDKGVENVKVCDAMAVMCGSGRASFIVGPSTRNQRTERMWRDVFRSVCHCFYHIFYAMEECQLLDTDNMIHLSLLHLIFIPRINYVPEEYQKLFIQSTLALWYVRFKQPTITDGALDEDP